MNEIDAQQEFDNRAFLRDTYKVTNYYHEAQLSRDPSKKYLNTDWLIQALEQLDVYKGELPADTDEEHKKTLHRLFDDYESGELQKYRDTLQVNLYVAAYEDMKNRWQAEVATYGPGKEPSLETIYDLLNVSRDNSLKAFKQAVASFEPAVKAQFLDRISLSEAQLDSELNKMHKGMALACARALLGGNTMSGDYKEALEELTEAKVDMNSEHTYTAIGMKKDKFWAGHKNEMAEKASTAAARQQRINP